MQRKTFSLIALMLLSLSVAAQTDVSQYFIENYGFDANFDYLKSSDKAVAQEIKEVKGWTQDFTMNYTITGVYEFGFQGTFNGGSVPAQGYDGEAGGGLALSTGWEENMAYYQTVTLTAGTYTLKVPTYNGYTATSGSSLLAWIPASGSSVSSKLSGYPSKEWTLDQITFTLTKTTTGKIRIGYKAGSGGSANSANLVIDYVQLLATDMAVDKAELLTTIETANGYYGDGSGNEAQALKDAIGQAQAVADDETVDQIAVIKAKADLQAAIDAYRKENVSEENPLDYTAYITNPSFEDSTNGWTVANMQAQSNSSFTKKSGSYYVEKWTSSGSVGDGSVRQTIAIPNGKYILTAAAQNLTQSSTTKKNTGAYIFAGDKQTVVQTPGDYSVAFTSIAGQVEIGFAAENATGNWICIDNFRLSLVGYVDDSQLIDELKRIVEEAKTLQQTMMSAVAAAGLQTQIDDAEKIIDGTYEYNAKVTLALQEAIEKAKQSASDYEALQAAINDTEATYDAEKEGAEQLLAELTAAKAMMTNGDVTTDDIQAEIEALATAKLLFLVANGSGKEPVVTTRTDFMIPAAHGGLIRATFGSGVSYKERGICWSTEKEPTIADHRETDYYSQKGMLFHVKGMEPASVYYARAYAITSTYAVGYGDVIKVVTLPNGGCVGTWDNGAPDEAANNRCRTAIQQTMDYLNEWTAIKGFTLSGHYGASTPTADCSYGGYMRIGPNAGNQAIGTVIHETGHGVGVGTHWRWYSCADTRANTTYGKWLGSWANKTLHFLENTDDEAVFMTGDAVHGWGTGPNISYDWFVNGSDKDKHTPAQYIGGCALLYSLYVDGLCPTSGYSNGVPGYTFNYDDDQQYCIMSEDAERGLGEGFVYQRAATAVGWKKVANQEQLSDSVRWTLEYVPAQGYYRFKNVATGKYITHSATGSSVTMKSTQKPSTTENFQLMPGRNDVSFTINGEKLTLPSYWFTWHDSADKSMSLNQYLERTGYGMAAIVNFNYSDSGGTTQRYVIIPASQVEQLLPKKAKLRGDVNLDGKVDISDIVAIINQIAGTATYDNADVNEDTNVDISDIVAVINIIAGEEE